MEESEFNRCIDATLFSIEEAIDNTDADIDYDTVAGILTLEFNDQSKIIINRQTATRQLWIAARSGGFHLDYINHRWFSKKEDLELQPLLQRLCCEQAQTAIHLSIAAG